MSTTLIGTTWIQGRSGSHADDNSREFTNIFLVKSDGPRVGPSAVLNTPGIPAMGAAYEGESSELEVDLGAIVRRRAARQDSVAPQLWIVDVTYSVKPLEGGSNNPNAGNPAQQDPNPLARPPLWELTFQEFERPVTEGILVNADDELVDGETVVPIVNSTGDPYDPPPMRDDSRIVLVITRNEAWPASAVTARQYKDAVNSDVFFGIPAGFCKFKSIRGRNAYDPTYGPYIIATYEFQVREGNFTGDNWNLNLMDMGMRYLDGEGNAQPIMQQGVAVAAAVRLNGSGIPLDKPEDPTVYRRWRQYPRKPFAPLGLE